ncbi:hypothetical protein C1646_762132 [Rhizophagus diaphanus]|nr:hypothetical protein C1646_762132 [Rhizophagus diaphanus] [Rhizophagus sp. MUCL 43196]
MFVMYRNWFEEISSHGITTEYFDIDVRGFHDLCSSTSDPSSKLNLEVDIESEYFDFRKRHKFFIHGKEDTIHKVDARGNSKKDLLNLFTPLHEIEDRWCAKFSGITELLNKEDRTNFCKYQIMLRNFCRRRHSGDSISKNNEDTIVHDALHDLIKEMFRDSVLELYGKTAKFCFEKFDVLVIRKTLLWLTTPDFKLLTNTRDEITSKHENKIGVTPFSIWIYDKRTNFELLLTFLVVNVVIPTERAQFVEALKISHNIDCGEESSRHTHYAYLPNYSNEAMRYEYFSTILYASLYVVKRKIKKDLTLAPQLKIVREESTGRVDYTIKALKELLYITEEATNLEKDLRKNVRRVIKIIVGLLKDRLESAVDEEPVRKRTRIEEYHSKK